MLLMWLQLTTGTRSVKCWSKLIIMSTKISVKGEVISKLRCRPSFTKSNEQQNQVLLQPKHRAGCSLTERVVSIDSAVAKPLQHVHSGVGGKTISGQVDTDICLPITSWGAGRKSSGCVEGILGVLLLAPTGVQAANQVIGGDIDTQGLRAGEKVLALSQVQSRHPINISSK